MKKREVFFPGIFPKNHPKAGQFTDFWDKIWAGLLGYFGYSMADYEKWLPGPHFPCTDLSIRFIGLEKTQFITKQSDWNIGDVIVPMFYDGVDNWQICPELIVTDVIPLNLRTEDDLDDPRVCFYNGLEVDEVLDGISYPFNGYIVAWLNYSARFELESKMPLFQDETAHALKNSGK